MRTPEILNRRPVLCWLVVLAAVALVVVPLFAKSTIITALTPGETLTVELARDYKIEPAETTVKIAGSEVGVVSDVEQATGGPVRMTLTLHFGTRELLGTEPTAAIRPTTLLGGNYFVQLYPGGASGRAVSDTIPVRRTTLPVELDRLLAAIPPEAQEGLRYTTERLDSTLRAGAGAELNRLTVDAPDTLRPAGAVADALRGVNKDTDLATMVTNLDRTATVLSARPGQLRAVVDSLADTAGVLGRNAAPVDRTIATLPEVLRTTRVGMDDLSGTLDKLSDVADDVRPIAQRLDPLLAELDPALAQLRPVLGDLRPLLEDAEPLIDELSPTVDAGTDVLTKLRGPVLDRVSGPILGAVNDRWRGSAPKYAGGGDGARFYEELGYAFTHLTGALRHQDATSHMLGFQPGVGTTSVSGTGPAAQRVQDYLTEMYGPPHRTQPTPLGPKLSDGIPVPDLGLRPPVIDPNKGPRR